MKQFEEELLKDDWTRVRPEVEVKKVAIPQGEETYILVPYSWPQGERESDPASFLDSHGRRVEASGKNHRDGPPERPQQDRATVWGAFRPAIPR